MAGPSSQQRRVALLAAIASAGEGGISRDTLLGLLWPESSAERARHALSQWLFLMRRDLETDDLILGSSLLHLNPDRITSDVAEFDRAVSARDDQRAAEAYTGPFLDGFFLNEAAEFGQWLDRERDRRHRSALHAIERVAHGTERSDAREALAWWQKLAAFEPFNGSYAANVLRLLSASGDSVAALAFARRHEETLRRELDMAPSPDVSEMVTKLRKAAESRVIGGATAEGTPSDPYLTFLRERLGEHYIVDRLIDRSSLASVFAARATIDQAPVTLKVFLPDLMARTNHARWVRALNEAAALHHPSIEAPIAVASTAGIVYSAFAGVALPTLRDRLESENKLSASQVLSIGADVAAGLEFAHAHDVVHANLTPRRIVFGASQARLAEMGFMRAVTVAVARTPQDSGLTLGSAAYLSPEQLVGDEEATGASDVYSLGCVLYQALTGRPLHDGTSTRAIIVSRLRDSVTPAGSLSEPAWPAFEALLVRMLDRNPSGRPTAAAVRAELIRLAMNA